MKTIAIIALASVNVHAPAQEFPDRASLNAFLDGNATTEEFESYDIADNAFDSVGEVLDSETVVNGQGPGLVEPGATYTSSSNANLLWQGNNRAGLETKTIVAFGSAFDPLSIHYDSPVIAFGLDIESYDSLEQLVSFEVFDTNGVFVFNRAFFEVADQKTFFGYRHDLGIGRIDIYGDELRWTANIDNHTYGVPAPSSMALIVLASLTTTRRR